MPGTPDVKDLIEANRDVYRGITAKSKLMQGTQIFLSPIKEDDEEKSNTIEVSKSQQQYDEKKQQQFKTIWNGATPALGTTVEALWASGTDAQYPGYLLAKVHSISKHPDTGRTFLHLFYHDGGEDTEVPIEDIRSVRNNTTGVPTSSPSPRTISPPSPKNGNRKKLRGRSRSSSGSRRRVRCGNCEGCLNRVDCQTCTYCLDKPKYGGSGKLKQCCLHRRCKDLRQK